MTTPKNEEKDIVYNMKKFQFIFYMHISVYA